MPEGWRTDTRDKHGKFTGPKSGTHTYGLGGREVREGLLRGRGLLARLPVGQGVLLLGRCGQQADGSVRGARPHSRLSLPRNVWSHAPARESI